MRAVNITETEQKFLLWNLSTGCMEEAPQVKLKEEKIDLVEAEPLMPSSIILSSASDTAAPPSPGPPAERASPPSSSLPFMPVVIKQEPQSPVHVSSEMDPADNITHCAHSTTLELPVSPPGNSIIQYTIDVFMQYHLWTVGSRYMPRNVAMCQ